MAFIQELWQTQTALMAESNAIRSRLQVARVKYNDARATWQACTLSQKQKKKLRWKMMQAQCVVRAFEAEEKLISERLHDCQNRLMYAQHAAINTNSAQLFYMLPVQDRMHPEMLWHSSLQPSYTPQVRFDNTHNGTRSGKPRKRKLPSRKHSTDSGFPEPQTYAQIFDLDPAIDTSDHIYSHEYLHPIPRSLRETNLLPNTLSTVPMVAPNISPSPSPASASPSPAPKTSLSAAATTFSCAPVGKKGISATQASKTSSITKISDPILLVASVQGQQRGPKNGSGGKRRYSAEGKAAIQIIESRLLDEARKNSTRLGHRRGVTVGSCMPVAVDRLQLIGEELRRFSLYEIAGSDGLESSDDKLDTEIGGWKWPASA